MRRIQRQLKKFEPFFYTESEKTMIHLQKYITTKNQDPSTADPQSEANPLLLSKLRKEGGGLRNELTQTTELIKKKYQVLKLQKKVVLNHKLLQEKKLGKPVERDEDARVLRPLQYEIDKTIRNKKRLSSMKDLGDLLETDQILAKKLIMKQLQNFSIINISQQKQKTGFQQGSKEFHQQIRYFKQRSVERIQNHQSLGDGKGRLRVTQKYQALLSQLGESSVVLATASKFQTHNTTVHDEEYAQNPPDPSPPRKKSQSNTYNNFVRRVFQRVYEKVSP